MRAFKRPENLPFPTTYHTFRAKDRDGDEIVEYRIQDLPESYFREANDLFGKYFQPEEEIGMACGVLENPGALAECEILWENIFKERLSIACFKNDDSNELVAVNALEVNSKNDVKNDGLYKDACMISIMSVLDYVKKQVDIYEMFNVSHYLSAGGLVVNKNYRGKGIATEMLKARAPLLKALGLTLTTTLFSGAGSQAAATKAGYEDIYEVKYSELSAKPQFHFLAHMKSEFCKIMALKIA